MNIRIVDNIRENQFEDLLKLIHDSFEEHNDNGLKFTCSNYTIDDIKRKIISGYCFFALQDSRILGVTSVSIRLNDNHVKYAYINITAISPYAKGLGIGTMLYKASMEFLVKKGCKYVISDTAVGAKSSVLWHLNKCGCSKLAINRFQQQIIIPIFLEKILKK